MKMTDVEEIIDYIKQLKKGFDKELFQSKIDELAYVAESSGLEEEDFHILFKIWLNLSIPITKWMSLGTCLVPQERVEERTVDYAFRWLLANCDAHSNFSRMAFLLDWLTASMDSETIDMTSLDSGYELFYSLLSYEVLTAHVLKLVYTLTKPSDVTRRRVLELLDIAKKREGKKTMYHQIQVLLGLFKSYKPECVPEDIPAISVHTSFKKINQNLLTRFKKRQEQRNRASRERQHLIWTNPLNTESGRNKKADPLVPNMEFCSISSKQNSHQESQKSQIDFLDPVSVLWHGAVCGDAIGGGGGGAGARPRRVRALLCNQPGLVLLALADQRTQAFFAHDLQHLLTSCYLNSSPHSYIEKEDLLRRLAALQRTLLQGIPVVTRFLAQYLPFWNERDYFAEILELAEWISVDNAEQVSSVVDPLCRVYFRAHPIEQCAILRCLTNMYSNLVYSSTRKIHHFMSAQSHCNYGEVLPRVATSIADVCQKGLQFCPEDMRVLYSSVLAAESCARAESCNRASLGSLPGLLTLSLPLIVPSAILLDKIAALLLVYRKIASQMKAARKDKEHSYITNRKILEGYTSDFLNCLYYEQVLTERKTGIIFDKMHPQLVSKVSDIVPGVNSSFSLRNNVCFAPYVFMQMEAVDPSDASNKLCFDTIVSHTFPYLSEFLKKSIRDLH